MLYIVDLPEWWRFQTSAQNISAFKTLRAMVRPGGAAASRKVEKDGGGASSADKAEEIESKRLRDLALSTSVLARYKAQAQHPLSPSKMILTADGKDIVKKSNRKSKYLFAFPGLMAPVAGGKLGDLTNLDSKNPILYIDFPQGRLKLFGTIVYPKNKYLTLQFVRGSGSILCEDCFESVVVFSTVWWIGTKEENPEEAKLPFPKAFEQVKHKEFDFIGGAGRARDVLGEQNDKTELMTPPFAKENVEGSLSSGEDIEVQTTGQPVRQSARTAGRKLRYADISSDEEEDISDMDTDTDIPKLKKTAAGVDKEQTITGEGAFSILDSKESIIEIPLESDEDTPWKKVSNASCHIPLSSQADVSDSQAYPSVLKQSTLDVFAVKSGLQEEISPELKAVALTSKSKKDSVTKELKRVSKPRQDFESEGTPLKGRKCTRSEGVSRTQGRSGHSRSNKGDTEVAGVMLKGTGIESKRKISVRPKAATWKPSKGVSDSDENPSLYQEVSDDDSDEDWTG